MARRYRWLCYLCGRKCVQCVDGLGRKYMGCPCCIICLPGEEPTRG